MSAAKTLRTPRPDVATLAADAQDRLRSLETLILAAESLADHRRVHAALMVCADSDAELAKQLNLACEDWREPALAPDVPGGDPLHLLLRAAAGLAHQCVHELGGVHEAAL